MKKRKGTTKVNKQAIQVNKSYRKGRGWADE